MAKNKSKFSNKQLVEIQEQMDTESELYDYFTKDYPFEVIDSKYGEEEDNDSTLYVPSYQREFVWDNKKQSRFIESVFLWMPLTPFLAFEDNNRLEIIDGSQRIRTLIAFHNNTLKLRNLEKLNNFNGAKFKDLPIKTQRNFENRDFRFIIVNKINDNTKQDMFNRINTSGQQLTDSEIRKGSYAGNFYNMILELKEHVKFQSVCPISNTRVKRGEYEELILRFFTYKDRYLDSKNDVAIFLNEYLANMNKTDFVQDDYVNAFNKMVNFVDKEFPNGFRKDKRNQSIPRVRFEAISVGVYLALAENSNLSNPDMQWLNSEGFKIQTTSDTSNGPNRLKGRIEFVRDGLLGKLYKDRLANG